MTHLHFIIWAYRSIDPETGNFIDNTTLDLMAEDLEAAMERARKIIPGKKYRVHMVIEHFNDQPCRTA